MQLTKNFELDEFLHSDLADKKNISNLPSKTEEKEVYENLQKLAIAMQALRDEFGRPIFISSGFRSKKLNELVGGVESSHHRLGLACDFYISNISSNRALVEHISTILLSQKIRFDQIIMYPKESFIHLSVASTFRAECKICKYGNNGKRVGYENL